MAIRSLQCRNQSGISKLALLIFVPLIGATLYSGYRIIPFYYDYYELINQMESLARVASVNTDQELRQKLKAHLKRTNLPITIDDITLERFGDSIRMSTNYEEVFDITWQDKEYTIHTFEFDVLVEERF